MTFIGRIEIVKEMFTNPSLRCIVKTSPFSIITLINRKLQKYNYAKLTKYGQKKLITGFISVRDILHALNHVPAGNSDLYARKETVKFIVKCYVLYFIISVRTYINTTIEVYREIKSVDVRLLSDQVARLTIVVDSKQKF